MNQKSSLREGPQFVSQVLTANRAMTNRRLLKYNTLSGPEEVERLNLAYRNVSQSIHLVDRNDPIAEIVADTVIRIGATGVRDPKEISKIAVKQLGF
jgi:hypothetical protein